MRPSGCLVPLAACAACAASFLALPDLSWLAMMFPLLDGAAHRVAGPLASDRHRRRGRVPELPLGPVSAEDSFAGGVWM